MSDEILRAILQELSESRKENNYRFPQIDNRFSQIDDRFSQIEEVLNKMAKDTRDIKLFLEKKCPINK